MTDTRPLTDCGGGICTDLGAMCDACIDAEQKTTFWTRHGVRWERRTDPAGTIYFHFTPEYTWAVLEGYRGWYVARNGEHVRTEMSWDEALQVAADDIAWRTLAAPLSADPGDTP